MPCQYNGIQGILLSVYNLNYLWLVTNQHLSTITDLSKLSDTRECDLSMEEHFFRYSILGEGFSQQSLLTIETAFRNSKVLSH